MELVTHIGDNEGFVLPNTTDLYTFPDFCFTNSFRSLPVRQKFSASLVKAFMHEPSSGPLLLNALL